MSSEQDAQFHSSGDVRGESFGDRLRREIRLAGFDSARKFALHIEMEPNYLSRILTGQVKRPEPETLSKFAAGLEVPEVEVWRWAGMAPAPVKAEEIGRESEDVLDTLIDLLRHDSDVMTQLTEAGGADEEVLHDIAEVMKTYLRSLARVRRVR